MNIRSAVGRVSIPFNHTTKKNTNNTAGLLCSFRSFTQSSSPSADVPTSTSSSYDYSSASTATTSTTSTLKSLPLYDFFANVKAKPSYHLQSGAAGFSKRRNNNIPTSQAYCSHQIGEDAYFRRSDSLGVADGVGGWVNTKGAHPALYARKLMHHAYLELDRYDNIEDPLFCEYENANPLTILQHSYEQTTREAQHEELIGSSTACIGLLRNDELRVANLGDCGISIIRHQQYVFRSEEQQHAFNFPYQLGTHSRDKPRHADAFTVKIEKGDIVIMATDGLFDNVFDRDILDLIQQQLIPYSSSSSSLLYRRHQQYIQPQLIANTLATHAKNISESNRSVDTPFQKRAMNEGIPFIGGKADDISVLVAIVDDCEDSPDRRL
ncbi:phosphatase 2C-like domain-containing protein [Cunninghamella echinulata]|nr:phosphatase 2C-like domain-containing protein [Cunninghamella echinulata]